MFHVTELQVDEIKTSKSQIHEISDQLAGIKYDIEATEDNVDTMIDEDKEQDDQAAVLKDKSSV